MKGRLFASNHPFAAGPGGQGHVKIRSLPVSSNLHAPKTRSFQARCTQDGPLTSTLPRPVECFDRNTVSRFGGQIPLHLPPPSNIRQHGCLSSGRTEICNFGAFFQVFMPAVDMPVRKRARSRFKSYFHSRYSILRGREQHDHRPGIFASTESVRIPASPAGSTRQ